MSLSNLYSTSAALQDVSKQADSEPVMFSGAAEDPSASAFEETKGDNSKCRLIQLLQGNWGILYTKEEARVTEY